MSAIERSRRTIFVLSENFVQSDWCRYELDFSHFWLFDAGGDAAILILLEPLAKDNVPKRFYKLRKLMSSTTYLEWPQEEERREEFWRSLRNALKGEDDWKWERRRGSRKSKENKRKQNGANIHPRKEDEKKQGDRHSTFRFVHLEVSVFLTMQLQQDNVSLLSRSITPNIL